MGDKHNKGKATGDFKGEKKKSDYQLQKSGQGGSSAPPSASIGLNPHPKHR